MVDHSSLRRGKLTANEKWGNAPSVLVGDFLYSRAFQLMVEVGSLEVMGVLSSATNTIAQGEVMQLANVGNLTLTESEYREVIRCKTALLFEAATHTGALLASGNGADQVSVMSRFGQHFGMTYQLVDDWLDYAGDAQTMGKNVGDDLNEGKLTLPLIYALEHSNSNSRGVICNAVANQSADELDTIIEIVNDSGALDYTHKAAVAEAQCAIDCLASLPDTPYLTALRDLTNYSTSRLY